ncbi:radical SAM family heme chaperone HemW [Calditerrivibrio nitroreducens]|uniref:Heme chaperone HemW n=1 Tax=Calditerrivibrio nitroreducens (strain DSM 19672 / NBRC 101217 / Yu37-1) TaxID=768670 RepID=E4TER5_CALNY|nr:radical SAM family heme chaperone HemW [Calditerrivibrio nitroreducens]ADR19422.1 oxygen-independent coproporphyrinogen III oxidase [Calditerrivibrio nitroreducens DSM 19672]
MKDYGLYLHIPFCKSKCKYCGFYSTLHNEETEYAYINAILREIKTYKGLSIDTIYIGGGTPSTLKLQNMKVLLEALYENFVPNIKEFTVEINPESVTEDMLKLLKDYGVDRISLGIQSLFDNVLCLLGRVHSSFRARRAIELILNYGLELNCDIIYDIPTVNHDFTLKTLEILTDYPIKHISAYNYSFDTDFLSEYKDTDAETFFNDVVDFLYSRGFFQYEISNFARNGKGSKHNTKYWKMQDYIGFGISAHSMMNGENARMRWCNKGTVEEYIKEQYIIEKYEVPIAECFIEDVVFGIRMVDGVNIESLKSKYGGEVVEEFMKKIVFLKDENFICYERGCLCLTRKGQLYLDSVQQYFWDLFYS